MQELWKSIVILIIILAIIGGIIYGIVYAAKLASANGGDKRPRYEPLTLFGPSYPTALEFSDVGAGQMSNGKYQLFFSKYGGRGGRWVNPYIVLYNPALGGVEASTFDTEDAARAFVSTIYDSTNINKAFAAVSSKTPEETFNVIEYIFDVRGKVFVSS
jgi:hypothetical protein